MNYIYESYFKNIEGNRYYFVKKFFRFSDANHVSDILEGYGMHHDFKKACSIAGVKEASIQQQIYEQMLSKVQPAVVVVMNQQSAVVRSITG